VLIANKQVNTDFFKINAHVVNEPVWEETRSAIHTATALKEF